MTLILIDPIGKPRMVKSDAWRGRKCVTQYWQYKAALRSLLPGYIPDGILEVIFILPMPKSWSKAKQAVHCGQPHRAKPDLDNIVKGFLDCLTDDDTGIYEIHARKLWGERGAIQLPTLILKEGIPGDPY